MLFDKIFKKKNLICDCFLIDNLNKYKVKECIDIKELGQFFKCSECGAIETEGGIGNFTWNYCPNCGAKIVN